MSKRKGGYRHRTRSLLRKNVRQRGKISISRALASYEQGTRVMLIAEPAVQKGLFHPRFAGRVAIVQRKQGRAYAVAVMDGGKEKVIYVSPSHLKPVQTAAAATAAKEKATATVKAGGTA